MWESFLVAFNAVGPFLVLLGIGALIVRFQVTDREFMDKVNQLNYRVAFPFMMFQNIYGAKPEDMPSLRLIFVGVGGVLVLICVLMFAVPRIIRENPRRGTVIQAIFRSNFVVYGIPLTTYVFGQDKAAVTGVMSLIMVSLFNISSVAVLEYFRGTGKVKLKPLLLGILKNPLMQGCIVGLLFFALQIRLPSFIATPVSSLAGVASTVALLVLGAELRFNDLRANKGVISGVLMIRLLVLPLVMLTIGWLVGLRGVELFLVLMIFGTPIATASYPIAQNMGADGKLAGQLVFVSTVASLGTIFLFIYALSRLALI